MAIDTAYAKVTWTPRDVQSLTENPETFELMLSAEDAERWLARNSKYIQERLIELGWDVIADLLHTRD